MGATRSGRTATPAKRKPKPPLSFWINVYPTAGDGLAVARAGRVAGRARQARRTADPHRRVPDRGSSDGAGQPREQARPERSCPSRTPSKPRPVPKVGASARIWADPSPFSSRKKSAWFGPFWAGLRRPPQGEGGAKVTASGAMGRYFCRQLGPAPGLRLKAHRGSGRGRIGPCGSPRRHAPATCSVASFGILIGAFSMRRASTSSALNRPVRWKRGGPRGAASSTVRRSTDHPYRKVSEHVAARLSLSIG
jgi:hypothetical protein